MIRDIDITKRVNWIENPIQPYVVVIMYKAGTDRPVSIHVRQKQDVSRWSRIQYKLFKGAIEFEFSEQHSAKAAYDYKDDLQRHYANYWVTDRERAGWFK
jgi:hypothetical protein|tara:strand:+ start:3137 stop:3436 length:300 start_codon:yes stop_codon:yes gene_type:complete